jgi:hypothetical protein
VTLVLAMSAPNAICMAVDYRVTRRDTGKVTDPFAVKSLIVQIHPEAGPAMPTSKLSMAFASPGPRSTPARGDGISLS